MIPFRPNGDSPNVTLTLLAVGFLQSWPLPIALRPLDRPAVQTGRRARNSRAVNDGEDFVPTKPFYLFGQHFSAIAAAGPIAGPIIACQAFGWLPCLLWIALGVVLIGAVHDFSVPRLFRPPRRKFHRRDHARKTGNGAGRAMMAFIWIALIYVIVAFTDITAGTFVGGAEALKATRSTSIPAARWRWQA